MSPPPKFNVTFVFVLMVLIMALVLLLKLVSIVLEVWG